MRCPLIEDLQKQIRQATKPIALHYLRGHSNTTRTKSYKEGCEKIICPPLDRIISIDRERLRVKVEPRVTMEKLVKATLAEGFIPPVVPEFKGITVGGALMGAAAESGSHSWGIFHDICHHLEIIDGAGNLIKATPTENRDLFFGLSGSYGSLGMVVSAELGLMQARDSVLLRYFTFKNPHEAIEKILSLIGTVPFVDGIIFAPNQAVIMVAEMAEGKDCPPTKKWYAHHVSQITSYHEEKMPIYDYLFRYDQGAFWMGSLLFSLPFLSRYISQGLFKQPTPLNHFNESEIHRFRQLGYPNPLLQKAMTPIMSSQRLWGLLHKAEKWIQDRLLIQDCSIPLVNAHTFLDVILKDPAIFPIWLCPLKGTFKPQHFAPHYGHSHLLNFGLYGVPSYAAPMKEITQKLEEQTWKLGGRKVLYSRSFYSEEQFWQIYPKEMYEKLRLASQADGRWRGLLAKVLSE